MSEHILVITFDHEADLLSATTAVRKEGYRILDAYTPYAVHGLDRAMGLKPSRLTWVCFGFGMLGALGMLWFEHWSAAVDWALDVGGKPWNSLPSDVPVAFESAVLLAGFGSVFALFAACRLYPGKQSQPISPRATDDQFVLVLEEADASFDLAKVKRMLQEHQVVAIEQRLVAGGTVA